MNDIQSKMGRHIGVKIVLAVAMTRGEYNNYRGWTPPDGEDQSALGYLVEYTDGGTPNHPVHSGYISWSPAEQFDNAYCATTSLNFGLALEALKKGHRVARAGWNGKGMWLCLGGGKENVKAGDFWNPHTHAFAISNGGMAEVLPTIIMKTADDKVLMGWLASQTDMLADDWQIV